MKISPKIFKIILQLFLVFLLLFLQYTRFVKVSEEETSLSQYFIENEIELPSITICFFYDYDYLDCNDSNANPTFGDYMQRSTVMDYIIGAELGLSLIHI